MVQEAANKLKRVAVLAALFLAAGIAQADVITGAGPGAGPDRSVKSGGKGQQKGGVNVAAGDVTGDGKDAPKKPLPLRAPISKPVTPVAPIVKAPPAHPKPMPQGPANIKAQQKPQEALLVPAVQKIREAPPRPK